MTLAYTYDGAAFTYAVAPTSLKMASGADGGAAVFCGLTPEDPTAALTMKGHRPFIITESACSQPRLFTGWTTERGIGRSYEAGQFGNATARAHDVTIVDLNALFGFRLISGSDGKRPSETWSARMTWLLGSDYLSGLIADTGYVYASTRVMDAADYRDGYPEAVMKDLMDRSSNELNYFAFWDPTAAAVGLWVGHLDDAVSTSTLRISNVPADVDGTTTFAPDADAEVTVSPTETYSEVVLRYGHGTKRLFRSRASTATNYIRRGTTIDRPYTGSLATASGQAEEFLDHHANEQDRINVTIQVPAAAAGLAVAGQRMDVKFSHLTGYTTFVSMRIVNTSLTPTDDTAAFYALTLELAAPRGPGPGTPGLDQWMTAYSDRTQTLTWPDHVPVPGHLLIAGISMSDGTLDAVPDGWTLIGTAVVPSEDDGVPRSSIAGVRLYWRIAGAGEDDTEQVTCAGVLYHHRAVMAEFSGVGTPTILHSQTNESDTDQMPGTPVTIRMAAALNVEAGSLVVAIGGMGCGNNDGITPSGDARCVYENKVKSTAPALAPWFGFLWYAAAAAGTDDVYISPSGNSRGTGGVAVSFPGAAADTEVILPPPPGTTILVETPTPAPDGTTVLFTLANGYIAGSLRVWVDGIPIPTSQVTETSPSAGTFTLSWAPDADESITAMYVSA